MFHFRMEKPIHRMGCPFTEILAQQGATCSLAPTSQELLLPREALAFLVTDLPPVVSSDPLHRQLKVLLLLRQEVPVL